MNYDFLHPIGGIVPISRLIVQTNPCSRQQLPLSAVRFAYLNSGVWITCAGLNVTTFVRADAALRQKLLTRQSPLTSALCGLQTLWNADRDPVLFDAVAVGMVLWPDLFNTQPAHITVAEKGFTRLVTSQPANADIATFINTPKLSERLLYVYVQQNLRR